MPLPRIDASKFGNMSHLTGDVSGLTRLANASLSHPIHVRQLEHLGGSSPNGCTITTNSSSHSCYIGQHYQYNQDTMAPAAGTILPDDFLTEPSRNIKVQRIDFTKTTLPEYDGLYAVILDNGVSCPPALQA